MKVFFAGFCLWLVSLPGLSLAQGHIADAPARAEGLQSPTGRLIIRGVVLINGAGSPPTGPVDIVVVKNRIAQVKTVGYPGVPIDPAGRPKANPGDLELDCAGMYLMPGLIDMHGHIGGVAQGTPAEYVFKLWMAHGITTIRDPSCGNGLDWVLAHKAKSNKSEIVAPRIEAYGVWPGRAGGHHLARAGAHLGAGHPPARGRRHQVLWG